MMITIPQEPISKLNQASNTNKKISKTSNTNKKRQMKILFFSTKQNMESLTNSALSIG